MMPNCRLNADANNGYGFAILLASVGTLCASAPVNSESSFKEEHSVPSKVFVPKNGPPVTIQISEDGTRISILKGSDEIGFIELDFKQDDCGYRCYEYYYITHLALERCRRQGIGTASLQFHRAEFGLPLCAASAYGPKQEDGSHLTGDGVPFIHAMRKKGIVCAESTENDYED